MEPTTPARTGWLEVLEMAEQSSAVIYTVGLFEPDDPDANPKVLNHLAKATGGEAFFPDKFEPGSGDLRGALLTTFAINTRSGMSREIRHEAGRTGAFEWSRERRAKASWWCGLGPATSLDRQSHARGISTPSEGGGAANVPRTHL